VEKLRARSQEPTELFRLILDASRQLDALIGQRFDLPRFQGDYELSLRTEFEKLSFSEQLSLFDAIATYHNLVASDVEADLDITNSRSFAKRSLAQMGVQCSSLLVSEIRPESVVEIFDKNLRQIWRSLNFYKHSSFPVEVLYLRPFPMNFRKEPESVNGKILAAVQQILNGDALILQDITGEHCLIETDSPMGITNVGSLDQVAPVFKSGRMVGLISVINVKRTTRASAQQ
jgi:hypothetical protein